MQQAFNEVQTWTYDNNMNLNSPRNTTKAQNSLLFKLMVKLFHK